MSTELTANIKILQQVRQLGAIESPWERALEGAFMDVVEELAVVEGVIKKIVGELAVIQGIYPKKCSRCNDKKMQLVGQIIEDTVKLLQAAKDSRSH